MKAHAGLGPTSKHMTAAQRHAYNKLPAPGVPQKHVGGVAGGGKLVGLLGVPSARVHIIGVALHDNGVEAQISRDR